MACQKLDREERRVGPETCVPGMVLYLLSFSAQTGHLFSATPHVSCSVNTFHTSGHGLDLGFLRKKEICLFFPHSPNIQLYVASFFVILGTEGLLCELSRLFAGTQHFCGCVLV